MKMTRILLGCFAALCIGFVPGCGSGTETTVVDTSEMTPAQMQAEAEAYEAEMEGEPEDGDGE